MLRHNAASGLWKGAAVNGEQEQRAAPIVDLRSDTVTKPTPGMRQAMLTAEVGDDGFGEDPEVNALQREVASLFGHEAALFVPSGTMGNQIALQLLVPRGDELLCDADAHILMYESGAAAVLGGITTRTWPARHGALHLEEIARLIRQEGYYAVPTRAIAVENTQNSGGGAILPFTQLRELRRIADAAGVALHCDGARIWHAHLVEKIPLHEYGRLFDTMSVCLSKGLGAPLGSLVIGSAARIGQARHIRKRLGGGMRQAGIMAAAGRYAVKHQLDRLADDHARARRLAAALAPLGIIDPASVQTNIAYLTLGKTSLDAHVFAARAAARGVLLIPTALDQVRVITHLDIDDDALDRAITVLSDIAQDA